MVRQMGIKLVSSTPQGGCLAPTQTSENSGFKSFQWLPSDARTWTPASGRSVTSDLDRTADITWPRSDSVALLPRLPQDDAIALALLAANGHMTWRDINAALDAKVKLAMAEALHLESWRHRDDAWSAYNEWNEAKRIGESEIWARYHAKCDAVFANDPDSSGTGLRAHEELLSRDRILDAFRMARDDEFAALAQRLGQQPARPATFPPRPMLVQIAMLRSRLTTAEADAIDKLDAEFRESAAMREIVRDLASEIMNNIADVA